MTKAINHDEVKGIYVLMHRNDFNGQQTPYYATINEKLAMKWNCPPDRTFKIVMFHLDEILEKELDTRTLENEIRTVNQYE